MARRPKNTTETVDEVIKEPVNEIIPEPVDEIKKPDLPSEKSFTVSCDGYLRVRRAPGYDQEVVNELPNGSNVIVTEINGAWAKIGPDRWVAKEFLK